MTDIKTKVCTKCGEDKPFSEYNKHKGGKFGLSGMCKECKKLYRKKWYSENPNYNKEYYDANREKLLEDNRLYKEKNKDKVDAYNKLYRENNKEVIRERDREYKKNNRKKLSEYQRRYYKDNKEVRLLYGKRHYQENKDVYKYRAAQYRVDNADVISKKKKVYYENNKDKYKQYCVDNKEHISARKKLYVSNNKDKYCAYAAKRNATKLKQTPELTEQELSTIKLYYKLAQVMEGDFHVDHIRPLAKGGLHHPHNLQILYTEDNLSKNAKIRYKYKYPRYRIVDGQLRKVS